MAGSSMPHHPIYNNLSPIAKPPPSMGKGLLSTSEKQQLLLLSFQLVFPFVGSENPKRNL